MLERTNERFLLVYFSIYQKMDFNEYQPIRKSESVSKRDGKRNDPEKSKEKDDRMNINTLSQYIYSLRTGRHLRPILLTRKSQNCFKRLNQIVMEINNEQSFVIFLFSLFCGFQEILQMFSEMKKSIRRSFRVKALFECIRTWENWNFLPKLTNNIKQWNKNIISVVNVDFGIVGHKTRVVYMRL